MTGSEELFHKIIKDIPDAVEGKMFGASCIKSINGKAAVIFWEDTMLFKLGEQELEEALKLDGAGIGSHLYAPDRPMKGWVKVPAKHSNKWKDLAIKAVEFVKG